MRRVAMVGASLLVLAFAVTACQKKTDAAATGEAPAAATSAPTALSAPPSRKAGLWSHTVSSAGANQAMKVCLDADTDAKMTVWGQAASKDMCAKQSFTRTAGGYAFESECDMGSAGKFGGAFVMGASSFARMELEALQGGGPVRLVVTLAVLFAVLRVMSVRRTRLPNVEFDEAPATFQRLGLHT